MTEGRYLVDAPLAPPTATQGLLEVFRRRYLLKLLVRREINARYSGSFLGLIWSYINPLTQLFIYTFIFVLVLGRDRTENFAIHVFCGLIVVHFFTETFNAGTRSIVRNKALIRKMALPKEMFPVASMMVSLFHVAPQVVILLVAVLIIGWAPSGLGIAAFFLALGIIMALGTGLALMFSVANVYFRDFASVVNILTNFVRFGDAAAYYLWNPLSNAVLLVQRAFWVGTTEDPERTMLTEMPDAMFSRGLVMLGVAVVVLLLGQWVFRRFENKIPERLT